MLCSAIDLNFKSLNTSGIQVIQTMQTLLAIMSTIYGSLSSLVDNPRNKTRRNGFIEGVKANIRRRAQATFDYRGDERIPAINRVIMRSMHTFCYLC